MRFSIVNHQLIVYGETLFDVLDRFRRTARRVEGDILIYDRDEYIGDIWLTRRSLIVKLFDCAGELRQILQIQRRNMR